MKIAFITPSFPLTDDSFSGVFVERLAFHIASHSEVTVITPATNQSVSLSIPAPYTIKAFRYAPLRWQLIAQQPGGIPVAFRKNRWLVILLPLFLASLFVATFRASRKADLIHANWAITGAIAGIVGKLTRTPVMTTLRGSDISRSEKSWIDRQILIYCLKSSQKIVTVCAPLMASVRQEFPWAGDKLISISNGVDDVFQNINKRHSNGDNFRIISIGSLIPRKNMSTIIRAVASLEDDLNVTLEIVGSGIEYDQLIRLGEDLDMGERLLMTKGVPARDVPALLENADVFILASHSEGRPNVLMEALAAGIPVVASNIAGVTEVIEDERNGLLFEPDSHESLATALRRLLGDTELRQNYAREGRKYIIDNDLNWPGCAKHYLDLYNEVANV